MSNKKILVVLVSNGVSDLTQASNQRYAKNILLSKKLPYVEVDGMNPEHHESREELFSISGVRGNYPQFFFVHANGATSYFGNWEKLQEINEASCLPKEILEQNPDIQTWDTFFGDVVDSF
jgi:hypothetical protein